MTSILDAFRRITHALRVASSAAQAGVGLSAAQLFVLNKLAGRPGASLNDLAALTHTHQSSVSVVVQRLVDRGLVGRMPSKADRRRLELRLTPAGRALLKRAPDPTQERLITAIQSLPAGRRQQLSETLAALTASLGPAQAPPAMFFEDDTAAASPSTRSKQSSSPARARKGARSNEAS